MKRTAVLTTAVVAILLSGCSGDGASDADRDARGAGGVRAATCTDAVGDGGPADLTAVELVESGEGLRATFTLAGPLDTSRGTALLSVMVASEDGETARQLGAKWIDGVVEVFVFDVGTVQNEDVDVPPVVDGSSVHVTFPRSAIEGLGGTWRWGATTNVDGTDVDDCPEPGGDSLNPARQTFPG
jgi:hypothetical protein